MSAEKSNALIYGIFSGLGLLIFYLLVITIFQGFDFAIASLNSLWYLILPLAAGFGIQIGLFFSIRHHAKAAGTIAAASGTISAGSMIACCSHFLLNMIPIAGISGLSIFLVRYQSWFLVIGIISNIVGIFFLVSHRNKIKEGRCK